jgi:hypothetical protein
VDNIQNCDYESLDFFLKTSFRSFYLSLSLLSLLSLFSPPLRFHPRSLDPSSCSCPWIFVKGSFVSPSLSFLFILSILCIKTMSVWISSSSLHLSHSVYLSLPSSWNKIYEFSYFSFNSGIMRIQPSCPK